MSETDANLPIHVPDLAKKDWRLREVHPEVSFQAMNPGGPLGLSKRSAGGALRRIALLEEQGIVLGDLGEAAPRPPADNAVPGQGHRVAGLLDEAGRLGNGGRGGAGVFHRGVLKGLPVHLLIGHVLR